MQNLLLQNDNHEVSFVRRNGHGNSIYILTTHLQRRYMYLFDWAACVSHTALTRWQDKDSYIIWGLLKLYPSAMTSLFEVDPTAAESAGSAGSPLLPESLIGVVMWLPVMLLIVLPNSCYTHINELECWFPLHGTHCSTPTNKHLPILLKGFKARLMTDG